MRYVFVVLSLFFNLAFAESQVPLLVNSYVVDQVGVLTKDNTQEINSFLKTLDTSGKAVMGVLITNNPELSSITVAEEWRLGHKGRQDGLVLLVNPAGHLIRLQVGRGLQGDLTDLWSKQVLERAGQLFKRTEYKVGVMHIAEMVDGRLAATPPGEAIKSNEDTSGFQAILIILVLSVGGGLFTLWWLDIKAKEDEQERRIQAEKDIVPLPHPLTTWRYQPPADPESSVPEKIFNVVEDVAVVNLVTSTIDSILSSPNSGSDTGNNTPSRDDDDTTFDGGGASSTW